MTTLILTSFCVLVAIIPIINGKKINLRAKRALFRRDGAKTNEYEFIEKALRALGGDERAKIFTDLAEKGRMNNGQIDDWSTLFGSNKKVSYTEAVKRVANELDSRRPDGRSKKKISTGDFNDIRQKAEQVTKDRANGLDKNNNLDDGHIKAYETFSTITKKLGGIPHESQLLKQQGTNTNSRNDGNGGSGVGSEGSGSQVLDDQRGSGASSSGASEVRNSGGNQIEGRTNTDSRNDDILDRNSEVAGDEEEQTGKSQKRITNSQTWREKFFPNGKKSGPDSDNRRSGEGGCGRRRVRRAIGMSSKKGGLAIGSTKCGMGGSRGLGGIKSGHRVSGIKNIRSRGGIGMNSGRRASGGIRSSASRG